MRIVVNCGTWIAYKSANGVCYIYRKLIPKQRQPQMSHQPIINMIEYTTSTTQQSQSAIISNDNNDASYVLITREEYDRLKG